MFTVTNKDVTKSATILPVCEKNFSRFEAVFNEAGFEMTLQKNNSSQMPIKRAGGKKLLALKEIKDLANCGVIVFGYGDDETLPLTRKHDIVKNLGFKPTRLTKAGFKATYTSMAQVLEILAAFEK